MKRVGALTIGIAVVAALSVLELGSDELTARGAGAGDPAAASKQIKARYESAAKISSTVARDKEYANLVGYAAGAGDFELAMEIGGRIFTVATRDNCYAGIVFQAMRVGDVAAADRAAEKISSKMLRDEQFKKIAQSCPSNTTTGGTGSILGLDGGKPMGSAQRPDSGR